MFSLMLQRNKLWARHCKACLSKGLCHQTEGRGNLWCLHLFLRSGWSSEPPANDDLPRAHNKFREARIKRYNYFINFTRVNCVISHLQATLDTLKTVVFLQVTRSKRVDKWSEVTKICEQNWASIWGLCFQEIHWSRLIKLPWKSTLFWCWVWNLLFIYSLANLHSTPQPRLSFQDTMFS